MNKEMYMVVVPAVSWLLFALGGTTNKGWRRYALPLFYWLVCTLEDRMGAIFVGMLAMIVFSLGYGDGSKWEKRLAVFASYGLISLPIGWSAWNVITPIDVTLLYLLSNYKKTASTFVWKICEGMMGALVGVQVAYVLMR